MERRPKRILVTEAVLPPLEVYSTFLKQIWESHHLTNYGPLALQFEKKLSDYSGNPHSYFVTNGTVALQIAIRALGLAGGEVITTPFSYVATTSSVVWENCEPVFVDIELQQLGIDADKIEKAITPRTKGILATHVFGYPCAIDKIQSIASKYNLKVIFDAAHAFGSTYKNKPLVAYGDISTLSFHATKLFHTVEGGAIVCADPDTAEKVNYMRNFGHNGPEAFFGLGINGKNSEFHAAMGLSLWPMMDEIITKRRNICSVYNQVFNKCEAIHRPVLPADTLHNGAYYPVIFPSENVLKKVRAKLEDLNIFTRRYFYPALSSLPYVKPQEMPNAESVANTILCLPVFPDLDLDTTREIGEEVLKTVKSLT